MLNLGFETLTPEQEAENTQIDESIAAVLLETTQFVKAQEEMDAAQLDLDQTITALENLKEISGLIEKHGLEGSLVDFAGPSLEEIGVKLEDKETALENIMDAIKKGGKSILEFIKKLLKKIAEFVMAFVTSNDRQINVLEKYQKYVLANVKDIRSLEPKFKNTKITCVTKEAFFNKLEALKLLANELPAIMMQFEKDKTIQTEKAQEFMGEYMDKLGLIEALMKDAEKAMKDPESNESIWKAIAAGFSVGKSFREKYTPKYQSLDDAGWNPKDLPEGIETLIKTLKSSKALESIKKDLMGLMNTLKFVSDQPDDGGSRLTALYGVYFIRGMVSIYAKESHMLGMQGIAMCKLVDLVADEKK